MMDWMKKILKIEVIVGVSVFIFSFLLSPQVNATLPFVLESNLNKICDEIAKKNDFHGKEDQQLKEVAQKALHGTPPFQLWALGALEEKRGFKGILEQIANHGDQSFSNQALADLIQMMNEIYQERLKSGLETKEKSYKSEDIEDLRKKV